MSAVDALADMWVSLADGQRAYGSRLRAAPNRTRIRESLASHVVTDGVRVARDDDASDPLVGFVMFSIQSDRYERDATRGTVENVFVRPSHRGRGVGTRLMDAAETALADRGADVVSLEALAANDAARRFYRERGYRVHRVVVEKPVESDTNTRGRR